jgi:hypothetical protein
MQTSRDRVEVSGDAHERLSELSKFLGPNFPVLEHLRNWGKDMKEELDKNEIKMGRKNK